VRPTIFNVKKQKSHFWKCDFSISNGQFDCIEKGSTFTSKGLHQWETTVTTAAIFYWLEDLFPPRWKTVLVLTVCTFSCVHWNTDMDTHRHICSKNRGCCGNKLIFILYIASKTAGIILKMPSFKGNPRDMALTLWLTDLWSNRILFL